MCLFLVQFRGVHDAVKLTSTDQSLCVIPCDSFVKKKNNTENELSRKFTKFYVASRMLSSDKISGEKAWINCYVFRS